MNRGWLRRKTSHKVSISLLNAWLRRRHRHRGHSSQGSTDGCTATLETPYNTVFLMGEGIESFEMVYGVRSGTEIGPRQRQNWGQTAITGYDIGAASRAET